MTRLSAAACALLALASAACGRAAAGPAVGDPAPAFKLVDLDGKEHSLEQYRGKVVVLEWINPNCPFSERHAREKTMTALAGGNEVVWLAVNSTRQGHRDYLQPAAHQAYNAKYDIDYPVLYDSPGDVGHAYDARTTPHMFVIDEAGRVAYQGAIDDDPSGAKRAAERTNYVSQALAAQRDGRPAEPASTRPYGCSVKY
jgi:peroxiredoxin